MAEQADTGAESAAVSDVDEVSEDPRQAFAESLVEDVLAAQPEEADKGAAAEESDAGAGEGEGEAAPTAGEEGGEEDAGEAAGAPAEDEGAAEQEGEQEQAGEGFDVAAFAAEYGISSTDFLENCANRAEALEALAKRAAHFQRLYGKHAEEVGRLRAETERLRSQGSASDKVETEDTDAAAGVPQKEAPWTEEQRVAFLEEFETAPEAALRKLLTAEKTGTQTGLTKAEVEALFAEHDAARDARSAVDAEMAILHKPKDEGGLGVSRLAWEERRPVLNEVCRELGAVPSIPDAWRLSELRDGDVLAYEKVLAKMQEYVVSDPETGEAVAKMSFEDARRLVLDSGHGGAAVSPNPAALKRTAARRKAAARDVGPMGNGGLPSSLPDVDTTETDLRNLSVQDKVGWLGLEL